ncbi:MAG: hypothetical protein IPK72_15800 [Candidatus Eisenbacteria bacterium]|nr:hypothetical protein [Candidatus Eisenbacteria bacterium]
MKSFTSVAVLVLLLLVGTGCGKDGTTTPSAACASSPLVGTWQRTQTQSGTTITESLEFKADCKFVLSYCCQGPDCAEQGCETEDDMTFEDRGGTVRLAGHPGGEVNELPYAIVGNQITVQWDEGAQTYQRQ